MNEGDAAMAFRERERARVEKLIRTESVDRDGVLYWRTNKVIPPCVFKDAGLVAPPCQVVAYNAALEKFVAEYRANWKPPTGEHLAELRAEFGKGAVVIDVIASRRIKL